MRHTHTHKYNDEGKKPDIKGLTYLYIHIFIIYINIILFLPSICGYKKAYKINQAKLICGVGSQDHDHLGQEVSDGKEARGHFRSSADVLLLILRNGCWFRGRALCENPSRYIFTICVPYCVHVIRQ